MGGSPQAHARSYKAWAGDFAMMEFMSEKADMTALAVGNEGERGKLADSMKGQSKVELLSRRS